MVMQKVKLKNGVDIMRLHDTIKTLREHPELAKFHFRASNEWIDGAHGRTEIKDFYGAGEEHTERKKTFVLDADEPDLLLGKDHGVNATEALLHALASCLNTTLIYHAAAMGVKIEALRFELDGEIDLRGFLGIDESVRNGYERINVTCEIRSDAPREKLEELVKLAQKRSPVFDCVTHEVPVNVELAEPKQMTA